MRTDVLIIGGGIAGLACGVALRGSGLGVTLAERTAHLGGRAQSWRDAHTGDVVDIGPHVLLTIYDNLLALLELLGTRERIVWHTGKLMTLLDGTRKVVMRNRRLPPPLPALPSMLAVRQLSAADKASNARATWLAMRMDEQDVRRLDDRCALGLLRELGVTQAFIDWFWATVSMAILNCPIERCSAGQLLRFFKHLIGHRGLHIGLAGSGLGELFAPQAARLLEHSGGHVLQRSDVQALTIERDAVTGALLGDGTRIAARCCVAAVPPQDLARIVPGKWVPRLDPSPYVSTYLWFDRKLTREQFWTRVHSPANLNYDFYDLSNIRPGWAHRPSLIAANAIYSHRADGLSDEEIVASTVRETALFAPEAARAQLLHARVHRIPMAIVAPYPGTERQRPANRSPLPGLLLAGDWTDTGLPSSMESAARSGWLAAEEIWRDLGRPRRIARPVPSTEGLVRLAALARLTPPVRL